MNIKKNVRWSKSVRTITFFVTVAVIVALAILCFEALSTQWGALILLTIIVIMTIFIYYTIKGPVSVEVKDGRLILNKIVGKLIIPLDGIESATLYSRDKPDMRLVGSGGFCGYLGLFYNKQTGRYSSYVGDYSQAFLIILKNGKKYVLSSQDSDAVVAAINEKAGAA